MSAATANEAKDLAVLRQRLEPAMTAGDRLLAKIRAATIATADDYTAGAEQLREVKTQIKQLENERKALLEPLSLAQQRIKAVFDAPMGKLKEAETLMKAALISFDEAAEAAARKLLEEGYAAAQAGDDSQYLAKVTDAQASAAPDVAGVSFRNTLEIRVEDITKVPARFLQVNLPAVRKAIREEALDAIPGLELITGRTMAVRT